MRVIRYLMMLMLLSHLVVKVKAVGDHLYTLQPMDHTTLEGSVNMKLSNVPCAAASAAKGEGGIFLG